MSYIKLTLSFFTALMLAAAFFVFVVPYIQSEIADYERNQTHAADMKKLRADNIQTTFDMMKMREDEDDDLKHLNEQCFSEKMDYIYERTAEGKASRDAICNAVEDYYIGKYYPKDNWEAKYVRCILSNVRENKEPGSCEM